MSTYFLREVVLGSESPGHAGLSGDGGYSTLVVSGQVPRCCCAGSNLDYVLPPISLCIHLPPLSSPVLQFVVVVSIINFKPLTYDDYVYPPWANWVGWGIALSSMILVPAYVIYKFFSIRGSLWEVSSGWLMG